MGPTVKTTASPLQNTKPTGKPTVPRPEPSVKPATRPAAASETTSPVPRPKTIMKPAAVSESTSPVPRPKTMVRPSLRPAPSPVKKEAVIGTEKTGEPPEDLSSSSPEKEEEAPVTKKPYSIAPAPSSEKTD